MGVWVYSMKKLPIALQLYTIREELEKDFQGSIRKVKEQGYEGVELAGCYGLSKEEILACLQENQLCAVSAHVPLEEFEKDLEGTIKAYKMLGCKYLAIPFLCEERRYGKESYPEVVEEIKRIAEACQGEGVQLLYHNHDFEFERTEDGNYVLDELYAAVDEKLLKTELDTCWIHVAGENPADYMKKYAGRCPIVHLKDYVREGDVILKALGSGIQDMPAILESAGAYGVEWLVVEQDTHEKSKPFENTEISIEYLKNYLV